MIYWRSKKSRIESKNCFNQRTAILQHSKKKKIYELKQKLSLLNISAFPTVLETITIGASCNVYRRCLEHSYLETVWKPEDKHSNMHANVFLQNRFVVEQNYAFYTYILYSFSTSISSISIIKGQNSITSNKILQLKNTHGKSLSM